MKKVFVLIGLFMVLMATFVVAQGSQGPEEIDENTQRPVLISAGQGDGTGDGEQIRERVRAQVGTFMGENGQQMMLQRNEQNRMRLEVGGVGAECPLCENMNQEMVQERIKLHAELSNGRNAEIKVMPDRASETAMERLRLRSCDENCSIELKEVGTGTRTRAAYEVRTEKQAKVFGLFNARMKVSAQIDAETGEVINVGKPWWAFLATEEDATEE